MTGPAAKTARLLGMAAIAAAVLAAPAQEETSGLGWYAGVAGGLALPQGGSELRRTGGASIRGGRYLGDNLALEASAGWQENLAELSAGLLAHWQGWETYGNLFGYSRFDPFLTLGAKGWIGEDCGQVGPRAGIGAFWHLTDNWSLRFDSEAALGLDTRREMLYSLSAGVQYAF